MKNNIIGEKIKALRIAQGLSQAELANQTALSLRTIQRIENGETEARGDSVIRLARTLNIKPEDLLQKANAIDAAVKEQNYEYLTLLNLSAISFVAFPPLGIIGPLVLWSFKKDQVKDMDLVLKRLINFQLSWLLLGVVLLIVQLYAKISHVSLRPLPFGFQELILFGIYGMYAVNIVYIIFNAVLLFKKRIVMYQPAIPFIR